MVTQSDVLFMALCIPTRLYIALNAQTPTTPLTLAACVLSCAFLVLWMRPNLRPTGWETQGRPIWWNDARVVHGILWGLFALSAFTNKPWAWKFLVADVIVAIMAFFFMKNRT